MLSLRFSQMVKEGKIVNVIDSIVDGYNFERILLLPKQGHANGRN